MDIFFSHRFYLFKYVYSKFSFPIVSNYTHFVKQSCRFAKKKKKIPEKENNPAEVFTVFAKDSVGKRGMHRV